MDRQPHPSRSVLGGMENATLLGVVALACLVLFGSIFLGPVLLPLVFVLALAAFAVEQLGEREESRTAIHDAAALGAPEPVVAWGKVVRVSGSCPDGDRPRAGMTFAVADGRVWPAPCRHAEPRILEAIRRMEADDEMTETQVRSQDGGHLVDVELHRTAPERTPSVAPPSQAAEPMGRPIAPPVEPTIAAGGRAPGWLPRSVISGFFATILMSLLFFVAFASARLLAYALGGGDSVIRSWLAGLTTNQALSLAAGSIYVAAALHVVVGVCWAVLYAGVFEPRLSGPSWARGLKFALLPWILSLVVFLPLVGGGPLGLSLGAGPLPAIGNLLLHLVYGASLGALYGPLGDIPADQFPRTWQADSAWTTGFEERAMERGIVFGAVAGALVGIAGVLIATGVPDGMILGAPPIAFFVVSIVLGAAFGCFAGSMFGLSPHEPGRVA